jgi:predicted nucleotidyltransferase
LGIEYTKAILKNGYDMQIYPIKREGSAYRDNTLSSGIHPSASAIRGEIAKGNYASIVNFVPEFTYKALKNGEIASLEHISDGILLALRLTDVQKLDVAISDVGLINRILTLSHECSSFNELWEKLQTKKYTASSLRRAILYILLGIKQSDLDTMPIYTTLLAANERGREYLGAIRKKETGIKIVTKPANAQESRQSDLNKRADALYTMCFANKKESGIYLRKSPAIE